MGQRAVQIDLANATNSQIVWGKPVLEKIARGAWSIRTSWRERDGDNWVLIRTAPVHGEAGQTCSADIVAHLKAVRDSGPVGPADAFE